MEDIFSNLIHKLQAKKMASYIAIMIYEKQIDKMDALHKLIAIPSMHYIIPHIRILYSGGQIMKICPLDIETKILMEMEDIINHQFELDGRIMNFYDRLMEHPHPNEMIRSNLSYLAIIQESSQKN